MREDTQQDPPSESVTEPPTGRGWIPLAIGIILGLTFVMLTGVLGFYLHNQSVKSLRAEVQLLKKQLNEKQAALTDMNARIENLSLQMRALKEYAVAHSTPTDTSSLPETPIANIANTPPSAPKSADKTTPPEPGKKATLPAAEMPSDAEAKEAFAPTVTRTEDVKLPREKTANRKPSAQTCNLVGKSPAEQAEIMKRCVGLID